MRCTPDLVAIPQPKRAARLRVLATTRALTVQSSFYAQRSARWYYWAAQR